jgi:hypothetical protein
VRVEEEGRRGVQKLRERCALAVVLHAHSVAAHREMMGSVRLRTFSLNVREGS